VLATLHANNSYHALGRILSFYTPEARPSLLSDLAAGLRAIVSQRLLRANSGGRVAAVEVLLNTKLVSELVAKGDLSGVKEAVEKSMAEGSQTFEQDLARLINEGVISRDEGLAHSDSPTNLLWRLQNEQGPISRVSPRKEEPDVPTFTEITLDVHPEEPRTAGGAATPWSVK
jgi:twitching motility protein PilU